MHLGNRVVLTDDQLVELRDDLVAPLLHLVGQREIVRRLEIHHVLHHTVHEYLLKADS
jgi:hypothetical protein